MGNLAVRLVFALFVLPVAVASAAPFYLGNVGNDVAFATWMRDRGVPGFANYPPTTDYSDEIFTPQGRNGNNLADEGVNEIGLHFNVGINSTPPTSSSPITVANQAILCVPDATCAATGSTGRVWGTADSDGLTTGPSQNTPVAFRLVRTGSTVTFQFGPGGSLYTASITSPQVANVNFLGFRVSAGTRNAGGRITTSSETVLRNLVLIQGGIQVLPTFDAFAQDLVQDGVSDTRNYVVEGVYGDFVLSGETVLNWTGDFPNSQNVMQWQIKSFQNVPTPEPGPVVLIAAGLALILARQFIRSRS